MEFQFGVRKTSSLLLGTGRLELGALAQSSRVYRSGLGELSLPFLCAERLPSAPPCASRGGGSPRCSN